MTDDKFFFDTRAKAYVRYVMSELNISASKLAKMADLAPTTLTRALNDPTHKYTLSMSTMGKIYQATGINFHPIFESKDTAELNLAPYSRPDFYNEKDWGAGSNVSEEELNTLGNSSTIVVGETAAGVWKAQEIVTLEDAGAVFLTIPNMKKSDLFALKVGDETGEPFVRAGEYVICVRRKALSWSLSHGDLVVVERWIKEQQVMELTLRRIVQTDEGKAFLRFDNSNAKIKDDLPIDPSLEDSETVRIIGEVKYAVRSVHNETMEDEARRGGLRRTKISP